MVSSSKIGKFRQMKRNEASSSFHEASMQLQGYFVGIRLVLLRKGFSPQELQRPLAGRGRIKSASILPLEPGHAVGLSNVDAGSAATKNGANGE